MTTLPDIAISIRQPWAWAIIHAGKDVENRSWSTSFRGPVCIHAAKGMTAAEFDDFIEFARILNRRDIWQKDIWVPDPKDLPRGGIVGVAEITGCVNRSASAWFSGPWGFVIANARPVDFIPCKGALGFFGWRQGVEKEPQERLI